MKKQQIKVALFISLMSITSASVASNSGAKQRPPAEAERESSPPTTPTPAATPTPSFWDWLKQYFVM